MTVRMDSRDPTTFRNVPIANHETIVALHSFVFHLICKLIVRSKDMKKVDSIKFTNKTVENMMHLVGKPFIIFDQLPYLYND